MENKFDLLIAQCEDAILKTDNELAKELINEAFALNDSSPKVHNLLGIIAEIRWEKGLAIQHYRAALALDASFKPAIKNLEKITSFDYLFKAENLYF